MHSVDKQSGTCISCSTGKRDFAGLVRVVSMQRSLVHRVSCLHEAFLCEVFLRLRASFDF